MLIRFLQQNAEWLCAIAITIFAGVQCMLAHKQMMQELQLKRLELANGLDSVCHKFNCDKEEANKILNWLMKNASNFIFLLKEKDHDEYKKLIYFLMKFKNIQISSVEHEIALLTQFNELVFSIENVLKKVNYGINNKQTEIKTSFEESMKILKNTSFVD